jgi:hypothetical protein
MVAVKGDRAGEGPRQRCRHRVPVERLGPADRFGESAMFCRGGQPVKKGGRFDHASDSGTRVPGGSTGLLRPNTLNPSASTYYGL